MKIVLSLLIQAKVVLDMIYDEEPSEGLAAILRRLDSIIWTIEEESEEDA